MAAIRVLASAGFFLLFAAVWVVFLAGTIVTYNSCKDVRKLDPRIMDPTDSCSHELSLPCWILVFQFVCLVVAILVSSSNFMSKFSISAVILIASCATIMMYEAWVAKDKIYQNQSNPLQQVKDLVQGLRLTFAGMCACMFMDFIYIITQTEQECRLALHLGCGSPRRPPYAHLLTAPSTARSSTDEMTLPTKVPAFHDKPAYGSNV